MSNVAIISELRFARLADVLKFVEDGGMKLLSISFSFLH